MSYDSFRDTSECEAPAILEIEKVTQHCKRTDHAVLDVIAVISNPARFERRYQLFEEFVGRMRYEKYVRLMTVELQQGARPFVTDSKVKLRTNDELWYKENLINIAVQHLPEDAEYIAWIDADIEFVNKEWAKETIEHLQMYDVIQMFSHAIDLDATGRTLQTHSGFFYLWCNGEKIKKPGSGGPYFHSGYCYAITKKAYDLIGGLLDIAILGSADYYMALGLIGEMDRAMNQKYNSDYRKICKQFEERCIRHIKFNVGYLPTTILHYWHGDKSDRAYVSRNTILIQNDFNPITDIKKNHNNLWILEDKKHKLRDDLRRYFRQRNEDCTSIKQDYQFLKKHYV